MSHSGIVFYWTRISHFWRETWSQAECDSRVFEGKCGGRVPAQPQAERSLTFLKWNMDLAFRATRGWTWISHFGAKTRCSFTNDCCVWMRASRFEVEEHNLPPSDCRIWRQASHFEAEMRGWSRVLYLMQTTLSSASGCWWRTRRLHWQSAICLARKSCCEALQTKFTLPLEEYYCEIDLHHFVGLES